MLIPALRLSGIVVEEVEMAREGEIERSFEVTRLIDFDGVPSDAWMLFELGVSLASRAGGLEVGPVDTDVVR